MLHYIRNFRPRRRTTIILALTVMMMVLAFPSFTFAASIDLEGAVDAMFDSVNSWIPVIIPIVAIGAGISIAVSLGLFLANIIKGAFKSSGSGR